MVVKHDTFRNLIEGRLEKRVFRRPAGFRLVAHPGIDRYTWSKSMDNGEGGFQDSNRITLSRAVTDLDAPHRFIMNVVYELPFGRGRRFGNGAPQWSDTLFGGWMMDGIINYQSGTAFGVSANNVCRCFNQAAYANSKGFSGKLEGRAEDRLNR